MEKVLISIVTEEEKKKIEILYNRCNALNELMLTLLKFDNFNEKQNYLYEKIIDDLSKSRRKLNEWWLEKSKK